MIFRCFPGEVRGVAKTYRRQFDPLTIVIGLLLAGCLPGQIAAQGTLSTILSNGPTANRINIVILSEGYTTNQLDAFLVDATNAVNNLLAQQPYQEYSNYFNAFAISVASVQSGSDHPYEPFFVDTYFNSSFYSFTNQYLITIPPNNFDTNSSHGQGKVDALIKTNFAETNLVNLVIMLVNDLSPGGSGNPDGPASQPLIASLSTYGSETLVHESGHAFGKLTDEYTNAWPGYVPTERPNATAQTNRALIKWAAWIATNTPLPTPQDNTNASIVGLFQGAEYQSAGWYRPKLDCKMQHKGVPFCEVCSEQLVKSIYGVVRPLDSFSPASTNYSVYGTQSLNFSVTTLQPLSHDINVQWYTNNVAVSGATNLTFQLLPKNLPAGTNNVVAVVHDPTSLVRNDPANLLRGTNTWTLNIALNELSLIAAQYLAGNRFRLTVTGTAPQGFVIQASGNFSTWNPLTTNNLSAGRFDYTNSGLTNLPFRFYRTLSPP